MLVRGTTKRGPFNVISRHKRAIDKSVVRRLNRTIAQFAYRMMIARDRSSDDLVSAHALLVPTVQTEVRRDGENFEIHVSDVFGLKPKLGQYIDTPEKAARLEARMAEEGWD